MKCSVVAVCAGLAFALSASADIVLKGGSDLDMTGSAGSQIVFPDGTTQNSALASGLSLPAGHGGTNNTVTGDKAYVGGGQNNRAEAAFTTIGGGGFAGIDEGNIATDEYGTIGGGRNNQAGDNAGTATDATFATIGGGFSNVASGWSSTIGGGSTNTATNPYDTVGGGVNNNATGHRSTIAGGANNTASNFETTVGGGNTNAATGSYSTVSGGVSNTASGAQSTVSGGTDNDAQGQWSTIGGGTQGVASAAAATIAGGYANEASGNAASVGGGVGNVAGGYRATVPGGLANAAAGDYSFATGRRAKINAAHDGSFLFADGTNADFASAAANEFAVRANGGVRFITDSTSGAGAGLDAGDTTWNVLSAKEAKENYTPIDSVAVLESVVQLSIQRWNYRHQDDSIQHIGPYAQDFHNAFGLHGEYKGTISSQDLDGVALAAIQGLNSKLEAEVAALRQTIAALEAKLASTSD